MRTLWSGRFILVESVLLSLLERSSWLVRLREYYCRLCTSSQYILSSFPYELPTFCLCVLEMNYLYLLWKLDVTSKSVTLEIWPCETFMKKHLPYLHNLSEKSRRKEQVGLGKFIRNLSKYWAQPGFEPGTSCTQSKNHTPRPLSRLILTYVIILFLDAMHMFQNHDDVFSFLSFLYSIKKHLVHDNIHICGLVV